MRWAPRKNAAPATPADLERSLENGHAEVAELEAEQTEIAAALPLLIAEPDRANEAERRLRDIEALLPHKRRALKLIEDAIPEAQKRLDIAEFIARRDAQLRATAKLQRNLQARYEAAAAAFAGLLTEVDADHEAWRQLGFQAQELGQSVGGRPAEDALRSELFTGHRPYVGLGHKVVIKDFEGRHALYGAREGFL